MALHGEHARCVIELLADIFTDAFECVATGTLPVIRLLMDRRAGKLWRQGATLGFLLFLGVYQSNLQRLPLRFNGSDIGVDQIGNRTTG